MGTQTFTVACNNCGAALPVRDDTRFVTCTYCDSRLAVHRTGAAAHTEILTGIHQATERIADDVGAIRVQNEVEALDREWAMRREGFVATDKRGRRSTPGAAGSLVVGLLVSAFGVFFAVTASQNDAPAIFQLFGGVFAVIGVVAAVRGVTQAGRYQEAEREYQARRAALLARADRRNPD